MRRAEVNRRIIAVLGTGGCAEAEDASAVLEVPWLLASLLDTAAAYTQLYESSVALEASAGDRKDPVEEGT